MDTLMSWLMNLNLLEVGLTVLFTSWLQAKNSKRDMLKGIEVSEKNKENIISEIRGQMDSIRNQKQ